MAPKRSSKRSFTTPFKPPMKIEDDFDSLGQSPAAAEGAMDFTPTPAPPSPPPTKKAKKGSAKKTPVSKSARTGRSTHTHGSVFKSPATPAQQQTSTRSSSRFKTPAVKADIKVEDTPSTTAEPCNVSTPTTGFAKLGETPVSDPAVKCEGPASEAQRDFDTLGETPGPVPRPSDVTTGQTDDKSNLNDNGAGRAKRRRTQTQFFGEVTPSEAAISQEKEEKQEDDTKDGDSDFDPAGAGDDHDDDDYKGAGSQFKRPTQTVIRSSQITGGPRKRTAKTFQHMLEITQFLASIPRNIDEIPFHPAFLKHRGWDTDGMSAWVMPHPLAIKSDTSCYSDAEVALSRQFPPGPPVCPFMVRLACNGRYPEDKMSVRLALQMRRSHVVLVTLKERKHVRYWERLSTWASCVVGGQLNGGVKLLETVVKVLLRVIKQKGVWNVKRFLECVTYVAVIQQLGTILPEVKPIVSKIVEDIAAEVDAYLNQKKWSPLFREQFNCLGIQYHGQLISKRTMRSGVPGSGPPFLTDEEFQKKYGEVPPQLTDEEQTRIYDNEGNVTGHFEVPSLRQLLSPVLPTVEEREGKVRVKGPTREEKRRDAVRRLARKRALLELAGERGMKNGSREE